MDLTKCYMREYGYNGKNKAFWKDCCIEVEEKISNALAGRCVGENNVHAKHTEKQIKQVIDLLQDISIPIEKISEITNVSRPVIMNVLTKKNWTFLTEGIEFPSRGHINHPRKLTDVQVKEIVQRLLNGEYNTDIAKDYNVAYTVINSIRHHEIYKSYTDGLMFPELPRRSETNKNAKLSKDDVVNIIRDYKNGKSLSELSQLYPIVTEGTIGNIIRGTTWKHINRDEII